MHDATKHVAKEIENWKATSKKHFNVGMDLFQSRNLLYATEPHDWVTIRPVVLVVEMDNNLYLLQLQYYDDSVMHTVRSR